MENLLKIALDIIFPSKCALCGASGWDLCLKCLSLSPPAERECAEWVFPLFDYRHPPLKKAIWLLKYRGKKKLAEAFAEILYGRILEELADLRALKNFNNPIIIPIPLSRARQRERGYNQTELICKGLIKLDEKNSGQNHLRHGADIKSGKNFSRGENVLIKIKETEHQARLKNRSERLKNLSGTFAVKNAEAIKERNIILIDDVTTTGATLNEAKRILKENGAGKIIAFTVAH